MKTRIGINGFGRMGRLALRAAWGWPDVEFVHVNEVKGGSETAAHLLDVRLGPRPLERTTSSAQRGRDRRSTERRSRFSGHAAPRRGAVGGPRSRHRAGVLREVPDRRAAPAVLRPRGEEGDRRGAGEGASALNVVMGVNDHLYDAAQAPPADGGVLHDQLPGAGRQGHPRRARHPARRHHDHPRHHEHADRRGRPAQGSATRAREQPLAHPHEHRLGHRDRAHLPRAEGQAERPRRARAAAERLAHRLRVRGRPRRRRSRR